ADRHQGAQHQGLCDGRKCVPEHRQRRRRLLRCRPEPGFRQRGGLMAGEVDVMDKAHSAYLSQCARMPHTLEDYLRPDRCALVMWDMQKGLAGKAPAVDSIRLNAQRLIAAADAAGVLVVWSRHILPPLDLTVGPF